MIANTGLDRGALHNAAGGGDLDMVQLLIALGADPALRDYPFHSTPIGWARYGQHENVVAYLAQFATIFDAIRCGAVARVAELLRQDPSLSDAKDDEGNPLASYVHPEMAHLEEMLKTLIAHGVLLNTRNEDGMTLVDRARARGWIDFADVLRRHGARSGGELTAGA
jgi:ankyrin repeat protein